MRGIYELRFDNGQCYIGLSLTLHTRISAHLSMLENKVHFNKYVQECYNMYGPPQFKILKFGEFSQKELEALESDFIAKYIRDGVSLLNIAKNPERPNVPICTKEEVDFSDKVKALMALKNICDKEEQVLLMEIELIKARADLDTLYAIRQMFCVNLTPGEKAAIEHFSMLLK